MRKWALGLSYAGWLCCARVQAQIPGADCTGDGPPPITLQPVPLGADYGDRSVHCGPTVGSPVATGLVSARTLAHKPSRAAAREFRRGVEASRKGQSEEALRHLEEAVLLDPLFVEAQTELGSTYAKAGQPQRALSWYDRALALDPHWAVLHSNRAAALVLLGRGKEAEQASRRALQLDAVSIQAHYMLGISLLMQEKITPEAVAHLIIAAEKYPGARPFLAGAQAELARRQTPEFPGRARP